MRKDSSVAVIATIRIMTTKTACLKILGKETICNPDYKTTRTNEAAFKQALLNLARASLSRAAI
jgi:hypothetical protein